MEEVLQSLIHLMRMRKATDAHFTLSANRLQLRLRCLNGMEDGDNGLFDARLFHYLKYIAGLDLGDLAQPQSGNFTRRHQGQELQFRFSLLCTGALQTGVLRMLDHHFFTAIAQICHDETQCALFHELCQKKHGMALFSGPTGSGKTTTLHALLREAALTHHLQVISLEDPIEIHDPHYLQLQVNEKSGFTYEVGIEQLLRHDPDVIMIGEVRNPITARMLVRAALSGHMVFSTVHAKSCCEVIHRLQEFGIEPIELKDTLCFVSTQRLLLRHDEQGRECIYEILQGDELRHYLQTHQLFATHCTIDEEIRKAWQKKRIAETVLAKELFDGGVAGAATAVSKRHIAAGGSSSGFYGK